MPTQPNTGNFALIMKGGGIKGLAYVGALRELEKHYTFSWFVGTSAGAITAALLAAGYKVNELEDLLSKTDFNHFLDAPIYKWPTNLLLKKGIFPGETFRIWIGNLLAKKLQSSTRVQLEDLPYRLTVYASTRGKKALVFDSTYPDSRGTSVAFAVRCSMAIPFVFTPQSQDGSRVVDGGVQNNYPVDALVGSDRNVKFVGLYLGPEIYEEEKDSGLLGDLYSILLDAADTEALRIYRDRTIIIDPRPISTLDFKLSAEEKDFLLKAGRAAALKFLAAQFPQKPGLIEESDKAKDEANRSKENVETLRGKQKAKRKRRLWMGTMFAVALVFTISAAKLDFLRGWIFGTGITSKTIRLIIGDDKIYSLYDPQKNSVTINVPVIIENSSGKDQPIYLLAGNLVSVNSNSALSLNQSRTIKISGINPALVKSKINAQTKKTDDNAPHIRLIPKETTEYTFALTFPYGEQLRQKVGVDYEQQLTILLKNEKKELVFLTICFNVRDFADGLQPKPHTAHQDCQTVKE